MTNFAGRSEGEKAAVKEEEKDMLKKYTRPGLKATIADSSNGAKGSENNEVRRILWRKTDVLSESSLVFGFVLCCQGYKPKAAGLPKDELVGTD